MIYDINKPWESLDPWQTRYINTAGNCFILCGRQSGKTAAMSIKIAECALKEPQPCDYLVIALTERQAYNLFFKVLMYLQARYPNLIKKGKDKPTMHEINLKNGVCIMCYACGDTGWNLHGYTIKKMFIDEAAPMNREVFVSVTPMLSVTGGTMDIASTPRGKEGYFYEASMRDDFEKFYISAEDCPRHKKEFLDAEKKALTKLEYAQEYLAQFLDEFRRFFSDELLQKCCLLSRKEFASGRYYLGMDIAGLGKDMSTFEILNKISNDEIEQAESIVISKSYTTETSSQAVNLNKQYKFREIGVDDGGIGFGVFSELLRDESTRRKVKALNNSKRTREYDRDNKKQTKLMKEDMYYNLKAMMENGRIKLLNDDEVIASLKSIQFEKIIKEGEKSRDLIYGSNSHITEGIIRAAWLAAQDKTLNIWIDSVK